LCYDIRDMRYDAHSNNINTRTNTNTNNTNTCLLSMFGTRYDSDTYYVRDTAQLRGVRVTVYG